MSKELEQKQIEEMALIMCGRESCKTCTHFIDATKCAAVVSAKKLYSAGYRKQSENMVEVVGCKDCQFAYIDGDRAYCRNTETPWYNDYFEVFTKTSDFCSYGAKMKGGAE